ncbi:androgen-dependent TFPI-regulating [Pelobates cultripes]|uniref:Androgen-dependent TFPI-regulating n=1 Tax=Pelobates cultripes TaxID=61616 RepID=A0AAD1RZN1_PELCU|nr:androgen-dependent TFPI-regulating [Pelobates cultripes]
MAAVTLLIYHCFIFSWYFFLTYLIFTVTSKEPPVGVFLYGGQWKYLTVLNVVLQTIFYAVCFVSDLLMPVKGMRLAKCIIFCRDLFFSVLAFPASTHTAVFPLAVLEILTSPHRYPEKKNGLTFLGICSVTYLSWIMWIYFVDGKWVYPFLGLLSPLGFVVFLLGSQALAASIYITGDTLNYVIWGGEEQRKKNI